MQLLFLSPQIQELLAFVAFFPPPLRLSSRGQSLLGEAEVPLDPPVRTRGPCGEGQTPLSMAAVPQDVQMEALDAPRLAQGLPIVTSMVEATPKLLTRPADLCRVVEALLDLIGRGGEQRDREPQGLADDRVRSAVAMMLHRRPTLLVRYCTSAVFRGQGMPVLT